MFKHIDIGAIRALRFTKFSVFSILFANALLTSSIVFFGNYVWGFAGNGAIESNKAQKTPLSMHCASDENHSFGFTPAPSMYENHLALVRDVDQRKFEYFRGEVSRASVQSQQKDYSDTVFSF